MKKTILICMVLLMLVTVASAETFTQSSSVNFTKTCTNSTGSICNGGSTCELTLKSPRTGSIILQNVSMTNSGDGNFNYTLSSANLATLGNHDWDMFCCEGTNCGEGHGTFLVTKTGVELSQEKAIIYMGMLALLVLMFIATLTAIPFIPSGNLKDEEFFIGINNLKYFRPVAYAFAWGLSLAILFVSSNISFLYLETELMGSLLFAFFTMQMWMTLPATIIWFLLILRNIFVDREMKQMIDRGVNIPSTP